MKSKPLFYTIISSMLTMISLHAFAANQINNVRVWDSPEGSRLIIDLKHKPSYNVFRLDKPNRIVLDLNQTQLSGKIPKIKNGHQLINKIRSAKRNNTARRVVIDTKGRLKYRVYDLLPNREYGYRLVVELEKKPQPNQVVKFEKSKTRQRPENKNSFASKSDIARPPTFIANKREIVIAIDAGHGGEDPGARGKLGTKEKDVVLKIAKKLKDKINKRAGMRAILIRNGDYYLTLRKRIDIARKNKANMFVSIHADAYKNPRVKGSSVFILSESGASGEAAKWLANRENAADLIGGVSLDNKEKTLAMVLLDLSQTATINASSRVASRVLSEIGKIGPVHKDSVQHAGFVVLKSPDIPSILIETAFISNPREEKRLRNKNYQNKLANAILKGVVSYFDKQPVSNTGFAAANSAILHQVKKGDTLSHIAARLDVSVADLKKFNHLRSEFLRVGQTLRIPFN